MSGELVGIVAVVIAISMIVGAVDLIRQPGWAWKSADQSKAAYLVLVLLVPIVGLGMYVFIARPKVVAIASAGRAASLPFERYGDDAVAKLRDDLRLPGSIAPTAIGSFGGVVGTDGAGEVPTLESVVAASAAAPTSGTFFSTATATRTIRPPAGMTRPYNPKQRTSLATESSDPSVPAGWKADPTGRHQFRYWDGALWTENVADAGVQALDAVSS